MSMKRILLVGGSDSSGGAGVEADQKVLAAHACYAMTATAALTAQNTRSVYDIHEIPPDFVEKQIEACVDDVGVDVLKTGMLASAKTVSVVANAIRKHGLATTVVDPVMVATTGARLLPDSAVNTLCSELLPLTTILTPNIPEANIMLKEAGRGSIDVQTLEDMKTLAAEIHTLGPKYVLLKGGHLPLTSEYIAATTDDEKKLVCNVLFCGDSVDVIEFPYQKSENTHGTGCSLASALACNLANGLDPIQSAVAASRYVDAGIKSATKLGRGSGPINHFHSLQVMQFPPGGFVDYILDRDDVRPAWHDFTHHEFVERMGDGTLDSDAFKYYMIQDYLYLIHFARANALAGYKAKNLDDIAGAAAIVTHIKNETELHINECKGFGLTQDMMEEYAESQACTAYTRYVLDIGQSEDWLALQISLLPCLIGYGMIARRLKELQTTNPPKTPNRYLTWINNYVAEDYTAAMKKGCELIEKHAAKQSPYRVEELVGVFIQATRMETGFWEMASAPAPARRTSKKFERRNRHHVQQTRW